MMALVAKMIEGRGDMSASMSEGNSLTANMNIGGTFNEIDGNTGILTNSDIDKLLGF